MTDNETVSERRVPVAVSILGVFMVLDSIILWLTFVLLCFVHTRLSGDIGSGVAMYGLLTILPWGIVHNVFVIGGIIAKLVSKKKQIGSIGIRLCLMSVLHVIIRVLPLVIVVLCELGKSV